MHRREPVRQGVGHRVGALLDFQAPADPPPLLLEVLVHAGAPTIQSKATLNRETLTD
jgi:hypothetical protein